MAEKSVDIVNKFVPPESQPFCRLDPFGYLSPNPTVIVYDPLLLATLLLPSSSKHQLK